MHQDNFTDTLSSEDQPHRGPAALLLTAGLLIGGGIGGFVVANAATSVTTMASSTPGASHPCPNMGTSTAN